MAHPALLMFIGARYVEQRVSDAVAAAGFTDLTPAMARVADRERRGDHHPRSPGDPPHGWSRRHERGVAGFRPPRSARGASRAGFDLGQVPGIAEQAVDHLVPRDPLASGLAGGAERGGELRVLDETGERSADGGGLGVGDEAGDAVADELGGPAGVGAGDDRGHGKNVHRPG